MTAVCRKLLREIAPSLYSGETKEFGGRRMHCRKARRGDLDVRDPGTQFTFISSSGAHIYEYSVGRARTMQILFLFLVECRQRGYGGYIVSSNYSSQSLLRMYSNVFFRVVFMNFGRFSHATCNKRHTRGRLMKGLGD